MDQSTAPYTVVGHSHFPECGLSQNPLLCGSAKAGIVSALFGIIKLPVFPVFTFQSPVIHSPTLGAAVLLPWPHCSAQ